MKIDQDGNLVLTQGLDREDLLDNVDDREATLDVIVRCSILSQDQEVKSFRKMVTVVVKDVNDNNPFPQQQEYSVEVQDNILKKVYYKAKK